MKILIQEAKNGENTASVDGHFLHSNYAPRKEAERFIENLNLPYSPSVIIISEPGLSYTADYLRKKFPGIKIAAIRYTDAFQSYDSKFDFVLNYFEHKNFEVFLENTFSEEALLSTYFISWPASAKIFPEEEKEAWNAIKSAMLRSKTLLITRQYFEKKWLFNSCNFIKYLKRTIDFEGKINKPALIISSGPSLIPFINLIKENQKKFFIICLSSAISVCLKNQINPDLCMTSDGGYWAGEHLKPLLKTSIPLAMSAEAYSHKALLTKQNILALDYGDGFSSKIINSTDIKIKKAVRNGTVSGTALLFAVNYCSKDIYFAGLDMACQKGFQHAQPNQLEVNAATADNRINTKTGRLTRSELTNGSLDIYKEWFINNPLNLNNRNVFRMIEEKNRKNSLGWIKDINSEEFINYTNKFFADEKQTYQTYRHSYDLKIYNKLFSDEGNSEKWKKQLFPLDFVQLSHNPANKDIKNKINEEWKLLKKRVEKIFYDNI